MYKNILWGVALISLVLAGCAKEQIYSSNPPMQTVSTSAFEVKLEPCGPKATATIINFAISLSTRPMGT